MRRRTMRPLAGWYLAPRLRNDSRLEDGGCAAGETSIERSFVAAACTAVSSGHRSEQLDHAVDNVYISEPIGASIEPVTTVSGA